MNSILHTHTIKIKEKALLLGFDQIGISAIEPLYEDRKRLESWLKKGYHGHLNYMENYIDQRTNPALLVPNAKSMISLTFNYFPEEQAISKTAKVSKYAYGNDYHYVIKNKLHQLLSFIKSEIGEINGRGFVDSAPIFEKSWAVKSGLGWVGKNGNLINKKKGSFFFIANLIVDIALEVDVRNHLDFCGTCNKCVEACPTNAIMPNKEINATQCISYYTIELKESIKNKYTDFNSHDWLFGCDICQDVCPWNKFSTPHHENEFWAYKEIINFEIKDWLNLNKKEFNKLFKHSALKRSRYEGIILNAKNIIAHKNK